MVKLSIVTINYNNSAGLKKTMQSVFSQTFSSFEYIVIDGGSADASTAIINEYADKIAYCVSEKDDGIYAAMNKGIDKATGEYVMFLNSGDCLVHANVLLDFANNVKEVNADIFYGNIQLQHAGNKVTPHNYPSLLTIDFWEHYTINHQAACIKTDLFKQLGYYDTSYTLAADYAFFIKCFFYGKKFHHINTALVCFNLDGASSTEKISYRQQMQKAWDSTSPVYADQLFKASKEHDLLMSYRLMLFAKKLQSKYSLLKNIFK
jgi:glycosyltransferase involved in cell wall biosynthesis